MQTPRSHLEENGCYKCAIKTGDRRYVSDVETEWLDYLNIPYDYRQETIMVGRKKYIADAYDPTTNTIYEFNGDFWHGNPKFYKKDDICVLNGKSFGELYDYTIKKENDLKGVGYNLISIWECDWNMHKKEIKNKNKHPTT